MNIRNITRNSDVGFLMLLFVHMSVLTSLFQEAGYPIRFVLALVGVTNSKKTSLARVLHSFFDTKEAVDASFISSLAGVQRLMKKYGDYFLLVDDYKPESTSVDRNKNDQILDMILRAYGDGIAKKANLDFCDKNVDEVQYEIKGTCMITGEYFQPTHSSRTRAVVLNIENRDTVDCELLSFYQQNSVILTNHLYDFLEYCTHNYEQIVESIRNQVPEFRKEPKFSIARYNEYYAQFMMVTQIVYKYAANVGYISSEEANFNFMQGK